MSARIMEEPPIQPPPSPEPAPEPVPPRDRAIWLVTNIIIPDELGTSVESYEGYAKWDEKSQDWLDDRKMSIRQVYEAHYRILSWMEREDRARNCPESETSTDVAISFRNDERAREDGIVGYYVDFSIKHRPTWVTMASEHVGPFATRAEALAGLARLLAAPIPSDPVKPWYFR